jgi:protein TonB
MLISAGLHSILLIPFWQFRTLELTVPDKPMQLVLEIPLTEQAQAVTPPRRQLDKIVPPQTPPQEKQAVKPIVKVVEKSVAKPLVNPVVKAPAQLPEKIVEKTAEPSAANQAPIVPEKPAEVRAETKPVITETGPPKAVLSEQAPPREVEKPVPSANEASVSSAYLQQIFEKIQKGKRYPRLARDRGIEGEALLEFVLAHDGKLMGAHVLRSSGFAILDQEALRTVLRAAPFPKLPEGTRVGRVTLKLTIDFALKD